MPAELMAPQQESPSQNPVSWAIAKNVSPEQMLQYYQLDREIKADAARNAFNEAFAKFKAEAARIVKNVTVTDGPLKNKKYADLFGVCNVIIPALAKHGLSHSWKLTKDDRDWMEVTCFLRHAQGHSESAFMGSAPDTGPGRNAIQARGSAKSYLERYTLLAVTGMAAAGTDDDGSATQSGGRMDEGQVLDYESALQATASHDELKAMYLEAVGKAQAIGDKAAESRIVAAKNKRYRQLGAQ